MARDTLTKDQIVQTAIELLDGEGLEGLNMRNLGKRLGTVATAVYWHVKNKDDLVVLVGDHVWNEIELPDLDAVDWRTAATEMAVGMHAMLTRHPWLVQAFGSYLFYGPGKARYDDHSLAVYEAAGFTSTDADRAAATVFTFVLGSILGSSATASLTRRLSRNGGNAEQLIQDATAKAAEVALQFPHLRSRLETPAAHYNATPEQTFEYGLEALLSGLEAALTGASPEQAQTY
ncbi:TetR/AcrR family transcriptional regulator C-terminal domain-containing protein [Streptomyces sp. ISL-22]|uniref:TetR/AcrR family transcriptional regulator n=1 Tax=unclassified Streptomyces TaxID=2593676 RepID=UPI001BEADB90|nr:MULTISPECIES: TetR/AcrR family transcriptional regulator [unclassified Streptomyces]MBT2423444.1 TetR/AcrR family transcriptional regulator C-terminal domain-containing protein [Streptomyces sp. ISL-24]MBT2438413.1 TetR/AcrR family transcriptional regulator C-terminal domain-containing protein [Streptomyces sp. ISL-22]